MFEIELSDLHFFAFHGVFPYERENGNEFLVDLKVSISKDLNSLNDEIGRTVSYVELFKVVKEEMERPCNLIETVAERIGRIIKSKWEEVTSGYIRISKLHPPIRNFQGKASVIIRF